MAQQFVHTQSLTVLALGVKKAFEISSVIEHKKICCEEDKEYMGETQEVAGC